ncbi:MAG: ATP-dependent zinc protease [Bacteroidia bacterium]|nr:ATP-dependent zinc protease [Bacteroidia bacterium]NNJ55083.1 ATP-dependent zinc protease [Bacteroidia bacterium]
MDVIKTIKKTIGIVDVLDIPQSDLFQIPCKVDTGAYNCSIDCSYIKLKDLNGVKILSFILLDERSKQYNGTIISTSTFWQKKVKSSTGTAEYRYQVPLDIVLFGENYKAIFNLSKRHDMRFPILLGRHFLSKKFLVDVSKKNLSAKR